MEDTPDKREYVGTMELRRSVEGNIQSVVQWKDKQGRGWRECVEV